MRFLICAQVRCSGLSSDILACDGCGACVHTCPMRVFWGRRRLSPRRLIRLLRYGNTKEAGFCVDCRGCEEVCPQGVGLRRHLEAAGLLKVARCSACGAPLKSETVLRQLRNRTRIETPLLCERCRRREVSARLMRFGASRAPQPPPAPLSDGQTHILRQG